MLKSGKTRNEDRRWVRQPKRDGFHWMISCERTEPRVVLVWTDTNNRKRFMCPGLSDYVGKVSKEAKFKLFKKQWKDASCCDTYNNSSWLYLPKPSPRPVSNNHEETKSS